MMSDTSSINAKVEMRNNFERKILIISYPINLNMCFEYSKERYH